MKFFYGDEFLPGFPRAKLRCMKTTYLDLPPLGYAKVAKESYVTFKKLKDRGVVPSHIRFQVSLPTPYSFAFFLIPSAELAWVQSYERKLMEEIDQMLEDIPKEELAIQFYISSEFFALEYPASWNKRGFPYGSYLNERHLLDPLCRVSSHIPKEVEIGFHFCYHFRQIHNLEQWKVQETFALRTLSFVTYLAKTIKRRIHFIHVPVPKTCDLHMFLKPLQSLQLKDTELYIGLLHLGDAVEGNRARIAAARKALEGQYFSISTECGHANFAMDKEKELLHLHAYMMELES